MRAIVSVRAAISIGRAVSPSTVGRVFCPVASICLDIAQSWAFIPIAAINWICEAIVCLSDIRPFQISLANRPPHDVMPLDLELQIPAPEIVQAFQRRIQENLHHSLEAICSLLSHIYPHDAGLGDPLHPSCKVIFGRGGQNNQHQKQCCREHSRGGRRSSLTCPVRPTGRSSFHRPLLSILYI